MYEAEMVTGADCGIDIAVAGNDSLIVGPITTTGGTRATAGLLLASVTFAPAAPRTVQVKRWPPCAAVGRQASPKGGVARRSGWGVGRPGGAGRPCAQAGIAYNRHSAGITSAGAQKTLSRRIAADPMVLTDSPVTAPTSRRRR